MAAVESATSPSDVGDLLCLIVSLYHCSPPLSQLTTRLQLDLNPLAWSLSGQPADEDPTADSLTLQQALDQILIFCNAHLSLRHENQVAVFAAGLGKRCVSLRLPGALLLLSGRQVASIKLN